MYTLVIPEDKKHFKLMQVMIKDISSKLCDGRKLDIPISPEEGFKEFEELQWRADGKYAVGMSCYVSIQALMRLHDDRR